MRRISLPWLVLATVLVSALLAWWTLTRSMSGEAPPPLEHENLAPFHAIEIGGNATVTLLQSDAEAIDVAAAGAGNPRISADVSNGRLVIRAADRRRWWKRTFGRRARAAPTITVHFRSLDAIALTGDVKLEAPRLATSTLRIAASGGSALSIGRSSGANAARRGVRRTAGAACRTRRERARIDFGRRRPISPNT